MKLLLEKFEFADLEKFCVDIIGRKPQSVGGDRPERIQYLEFIWENHKNGVFNFQQMKDYALKQGIIPQSFFE